MSHHVNRPPARPGRVPGMQSAISGVAGQSADGRLVSHRCARLVFAMTFLLTVFDFVDRQIVVSMFPFMKAE